MSEKSKHSGFWHTVPGVLTAIAAVITAVTGLFVALRNDDKPPGNVVASGESRPAENLSTQPARDPEDPTVLPELILQDVIVIFRDGLRQTFNEAVFEPGTKVCTRGQEVIDAIESAGAVPIVLTASESEDALQRGICDARTVLR